MTHLCIFIMYLRLADCLAKNGPLLKSQMKEVQNELKLKIDLFEKSLKTVNSKV